MAQFVDLPEECFPLVMRAFRVASGEEVWTETVEGPGSLHVPALAEEYGPVWIRIEFANGDVHEAYP